MKNIEDHLSGYGIHHYKSAEEWLREAAFKLGTRSESIEEIRDRAMKPGFRNRPAQLSLFHDAIADPQIAGVVQSMKAGAIRASGLRVEKELRKAGSKSILDVGCGTGYLTTWYAVSDPGRQVAGVDLSAVSIREAERRAQELGLANVSFQETDVRAFFAAAEFDAVIDTQTLYMVKNLRHSLAKIRSLLKPAGRLISIPVLETSRHAKRYAEILEGTGFRLINFDFIRYADRGRSGAYPVFVAGLSGSILKPDWDAAYDEMFELLGERN